MENGYTRIANELLEALCRARLGSRELKVVLAVVRLTYGFLRKENTISLGKLAEMTGLRRERLSEVVKALERKNVLRVSKENGRLILGLQKDYSKWTGGVSQKRGTPKLGLSQKRVSQKRGTGCPNFGEQGVPKKGNTHTPQSLESQAFHGPLKKIYKENFKETSSIYREDDFKEVISKWEEVFGEAFPLERAPESVRAADFMLYLHEAGRLPAVKRPSAYLRKLAASELEPFPSLAERRAAARDAEERMRELNRQQLAKLYARMMAEGWPVEVPEELRPLVAQTQ
ncbi:hypothetical protein TDIS_0940 [Thermosulfurimonas dismutans]|uniref:Bacteriophage lambda Replication protein O N-terminal domain-containing protein n=1 Tax=Thermosulfurimonas dismutans TaxID=999894 RepID=A0A179D4J6_9BACT|nr:hypothetical protein TDIS_0940 [Thermosulfurimonas dismutans]